MVPSDNKQTADSAVSAVKDPKRPKKSPRRSRIRRFFCLLILTFTFVASWYFVRPFLVVHQAKSLLTSDPRKAAELLEDVVASTGDRFPDAQVLWSRALLRSGRWQEALGCFSQIKNPELADSAGLLQLADDATSANGELLALMSLEAIPSHDPLRPAALERLIAIRKQAGSHSVTLLLAEELAMLQPDNAKPWLVMGQVHEQMMSLPAAAAAFREFLARAKDLDRRNDGLRSLIRVLIHLGERNEARTCQDELVRNTRDQNPNIVDWLNEGLIRRLEGNLEGARSQAKAVLGLDTDNLAALELRATLSMDLGDYAAAERDLRAVIRRMPWNKQAQYKLAQALVKQEQTKEADLHFQENRRLLALSERILQLQRMETLSPELLSELITAYEQSGMKSSADQLRQRIQK